MFTKTDFTDPQGVTHAIAVFQVQQASIRHDSHEDFNVNVLDLAAAPNLNSHTNKNINYQICYWPSQASKDAGTPPYSLVSDVMGTQFHHNINNDVAYDGLTAEQAAEKHCQDIILA